MKPFKVSYIMSPDKMQEVSRAIASRVLLDEEILLASRSIRSHRTADTELASLRDQWAKPENLRAFVTAGIFDRAIKKLKGLVPKDVLEAWSKTRGALKRFKGIFANPKAVKELSKMIGDLTPENIKNFIKSGAKTVKATFSQIRMVLTTPSELPTLTDLIKRTAVGAGIADWFNEKVKPRANVVDDFLKKHVPNIRRVALAAAFTFIWINVDELSWEMSGLVAGFTGNMSLADLLATLPESALGALSGSLFGIGYTIMPYMLAGRLLWLVGRKFLVWDGTKFGVNWSLVDKALFRDAPQNPQYQTLAF